MQLAYSDGRPISELTEVQTTKPIGNAPIEFSGKISEAGAVILKTAPAQFYRAVDGDQKFTLTVDGVTELTIAGTIRRR